MALITQCMVTLIPPKENQDNATMGVPLKVMGF